MCMRTNIELDDSLVSKGLQITGLRTKKDLVDHALRELVRNRDQRKILALRGKIHLQGEISETRRHRFP